MKKIKYLIIIFLCSFCLMPLSISANDSTQYEEYEFVELSKQEFVQHIAYINNISYEDAIIYVNQIDKQGMLESAKRGDVVSRGLILHYGYFTRLYYTPSETNPNPNLSTCAQYGVYVSYYLPDESLSWNSRRFNAIHDSFVIANNEYSAIKVQSKSALITGPQTIKFSSIFDMKRNTPFNYYVRYTLDSYLGL